MAKRPTPEELLKLVQEEEQTQKKGKLKIFLGAAPGVGKTYAMLQEAVEKKNEGIDVVAGIVETHGRKETEELLKPLELLPRLTFDYRGKKLDEFDLDKALKRKPTVILVDEMAHTNAPGARHLKRWEDIQELLDQGIHVYTTINVQHIESLNDIITQITGIQVRETVPDSIIEIANKIELVDLPPDDLLDRLREGKVYFPEQAELASEHFFRKGNLIALRELVLRVTADLIDTEVTLHRQGQAIKTIWPTSERLLVCIGPEQESIKLVRSAKRLAAHLKAKWIAVFIEASRYSFSTKERENALKALRLAETLGAETHILGGSNLVEEILSFARDRNVSKIIIGKHIRPKWKELLFKSLANELVRHSEEIDVYIIKQETKKPQMPTSLVSGPFRAPWASYLYAFMAVVLCTFVNFFFYEVVLRGKSDPVSLIMIYLIGVVAVATRGELPVSLFASVLSVVALGFFFIPHTFSFSDLQYVMTLLVMLWIVRLISRLSGLTKKQAEIARLQEKRAAALYNLSKQLVNTRGMDNLLRLSIRYLEEIFESQVLSLLPDKGGHLKVFLHDSIKLTLNDKEQSIAQWVYDLGQRAGLGTETLSDSKAIYLPLRGAERTVGVIRVQPKEPAQLLEPDQIHLLEALTHEIALALEVEAPVDQS